MENKNSIEVKCYSGYKAVERPLEFLYKDKVFKVREILQRWYGEEEIGFIVKTEDDKIFKLIYCSDADKWKITPHL